MPNDDDEFNQALRTTAGKLEELEDELDETQRKALNVNAQARGLIDQGEDLIDEYRGAGIGALRGVQSWADGNKSGLDDIDILLDDLEDQIDDGNDGWTRRDYLKAGGAVGTTAFAGGALGSYLAGIWPFGGGGGATNEGPYFLDRTGFQQAYRDLSDAEQMDLMGETLYQDMFDGEEDDIVGAYFDFNPSEDKTDSSFKYFFVNEIQDYMTTNEEGEEVFDYSALDSEDLRMGSTSWNNASDSTAETFENYGTRNEEKIPDLLEGGL